MIDVLGYVGAALLALCGVPLLFATRRGDAFFLLTWLVGELVMLGYVLAIHGPAPLITNYAFSSLLVVVIGLRRLSK